MCQVAAVLYACGICMQRFALSATDRPQPTMTGLDGSVVIGRTAPQDLYSKYRKHILWFFGFWLWGMGNAAYTLGLSFASLALMMSLFDTVLVVSSGPPSFRCICNVK